MESTGKLLLGALQNDLRNLSGEARKKHPSIKEAAERAIMRLRSIEESKEIDDDTKIFDAVAKAEDIYKPLVMAIETKQSKMIVVSVTSIHRLIVHGAVTPGSIALSIRSFSMIASTSDETIQLKMLQAFLALITTIQLHGKELSKVLSVCFFLHGSKESSVQNTAAATVRQLISLIFDRAVQEFKSGLIASASNSNSIVQDISQQPPKPISLPASAGDAFSLLQDICYLTGGDRAEWLDIETISKTFGLELIESILNVNSQLFLQIPEFSSLLRDRLCPLIIKTSKMQADFPSNIRLTRIVAIFIRFFTDLLVAECEVFLSRLIKTLDATNPLWNRILGLEVLKSLCESPSTIRSLYLHYDFEHGHKPARIFYSIVTSLGQFIDGMCNWENISIVRNTTVKTKYIDSLHVAEPPPANESYAVTCALDCLFGIVNGIAYISEATADREIATQIATASWPTLLASLTLLLDKGTDENLIQDVLKAFQSFTNVCCVLSLPQRDAFLTSLCKFTMPKVTQAEGEGYLKEKNIQAMKTLFNIAHCMGSVLEDGWIVVLETFQQLDRILHTPHKLSDANTTNELSLLSTCLDSLFANTQTMEDHAIIQAVKSLRSISNDALKNSKEPGKISSRALFGASKMVETAIHNVNRISKIWDIILEHFTMLSNHKDSNTRAFGVDSLTSIISAALSQNTKNQTLEKEFLETLAQLSRSQFPDCREKSLQVLGRILQISGQALTSGWPVVLSIVMGIPVSDDKLHVPIAFKSVQLISNEFLSCLNLDCLTLYVTTVGCYGLQTADMNISLTAINLLWSISDFLAKEHSNFQERKLGKSQVSSVDKFVESIVKESIEIVVDKQLGVNGNINGPIHSEESFESLWVGVFNELRQLGTDTRAEVRNCANQTLFKMISTHGALMSTQSWKDCVEKILFPLLEEVRVSTETAGTDAVGGTSKIKLMVHHTRNTIDKQWNESLVIVFTGICRVFKIFYLSLNELSNYSDVWRKLFEEMTKASLFSSAEVSSNAVQAMLDLFISQASMDNFDRNLWEISCSSIEELSSIIRERGSAVALSTVTNFANQMSNLYNKLQSQFSFHDRIRFMKILKTFILYPCESETDLSFTQESIISLLKTMPFHVDIFPHTISLLLTCISACIGFPYENNITKDPKDPNDPTSLNKLFLPVAKKMIDCLCDIFSSSLAENLRKLVFEDIVKVLGACMMSKYVVYISQFWISSVEAFIQVTKIGIPALNESTTPEIETNLIWTELADSIQGFLFHEDRKGIPLLTPDLVLRDSQIDISLVDLVAKVMLENSLKVSKIHDRLIEILSEGTFVAKNNREKLAEGCYSNLFYLCSIGGKPDGKFSCNMKIAKLVLPSLMNRCKEVLQKFIVEEKKSGNFPTPRFKLSEVCFILRQLQVLELHPELDVSEKSETTPPVARGKKRHLLKLFPVLCDCVATKESEVKDLLKDLLHEVGRELLLE